jgi:hypothetical protein
MRSRPRGLRVELGLGRNLDVGVARVAVEELDGADVLGELGAVEEVAGLRLRIFSRRRAAAADRLDLACRRRRARTRETLRTLKRGPSVIGIVISMPCDPA